MRRLKFSLLKYASMWKTSQSNALGPLRIRTAVISEEHRAQSKESKIKTVSLYAVCYRIKVSSHGTKIW